MCHTPDITQHMVPLHNMHQKQPDHTPVLDVADCQCIQEIIGVLLYYALVVDAMLLTALGTLATQQSKGTQATRAALMHIKGGRGF